jgi:hypothetical protein
MFERAGDVWESVGSVALFVAVVCRGLRDAPLWCQDQGNPNKELKCKLEQTVKEVKGNN